MVDLEKHPTIPATLHESCIQAATATIRNPDIPANQRAALMHEVLSNERPLIGLFAGEGTKLAVDAVIEGLRVLAMERVTPRRRWNWRRVASAVVRVFS